jgi:hypothetical protein
MAKTKDLTPDEILAKVKEKALKSVGWQDSRLSKERERVTRYYNGILPRRQHEGSSSYVSTDVYDAVEMAKAQLLEVFSGSDEIAQFDPDAEMDVENCRVATEWARYVIFRVNEASTRIFPGVIHDGLTARAGVVKVYWEEKFKYSEERFEGLTEDAAMALASQDEVDEFEATQDAQGLYAGSLTRKYDCSKVCIDIVAPEEFLIEKQATSIATSNYTGHRTPKTKAQLKEMGFPKALVDSIATDEAKTLDTTSEQFARKELIDSGDLTDDPIQPELDEVMYFESYVKMVIEKSKGARLYKVCHAGDKLLDEPQEVDKSPFIGYVPLPIPHAFYGNSFAARVIPVQNARTVLTRGVLDHTAITTNPRWGVVNGGLVNPKEMLENRLGGIVNMKRPDSVVALQYPNLNPFIFQILGMLKEDKEQNTGVSGLSQGLNKDAISKQNSQGLIDNLVDLSSQRAKVAARNFAGFFVELMLEVVRLGIVNQAKAEVIEVAGKPLQVSPEDWTERTTCSVSMHLGYGEKDKAAATIMAGYEFMAKDPAIGPMFTAQNRYEMIRDAMKLKGLTGAPRYITPPDQVQPPQPDPLAVKELEIKDKSASAQMIVAQAKAAEAQVKPQVEMTKAQQKSQDTLMRALDSDRTNDRQDLETASRVNVAQREMSLAETVEKQQAFIAPDNG